MANQKRVRFGTSLGLFLGVVGGGLAGVQCSSENRPAEGLLEKAGCAAQGTSCAFNACCAGSVCDPNQICRHPVDPTLMVTDLAILNAVNGAGNSIFSLQAVLQQLITNAGAAAVLTPLQLFQQWFDDENKLNQLHAGQVRNQFPHCDDNLNTNAAVFPLNQPLLNGFPIDCSRPEGVQTTLNPFVPGPPGPANIDSYMPIALVNRFDLAPADGANCGEYRIIFAKETGFANVPGGARTGDRNFLIFEGVMPNSRVAQGLVGCLPIETMWDGLSGLPNVAAQIAALETFYFVGYNPGGGAAYEPVVNPNHYGAQLGGPNAGGYGPNQGCSTGQIRTDQFMVDGSENDPNPTGVGWTLREFKLVQDCRCTAAGQPCTLVIAPMSVKANPYGALFDSASALVAPGTLYQNFEQVGGAPPPPPAGNLKPGDFTIQVTAADLADNNALVLPGNAVVPLTNPPQTFSYSSVHDFYNAGESQSEVPPGAAINDYEAALDPGFTNTLTFQLATFGSPVTPAQISARARALSCAGCHQISGVDPQKKGLGGGLIAWPNSQGFVHLSETIVGGTNYKISPALSNLFLVNRMTILENFIAAPATAAPAHQTCPLPFPVNLQVVCPIPEDVQPFPVSGLRALEPVVPFAINGFTLN